MTEDEFESRICDFEQAWLHHQPCTIAEILERPTLLSSPERFRLLIELIAIDLEFRWRNGSPIHLEDYAEPFPELGPIDQMPIELIGEEYRVRSQWGDRPLPNDFVSRFLSRQTEIRAEIAKVDRELEAESTDISLPLDKIVTERHQIKLSDNIHTLNYQDVKLIQMIGAGRMGKVYQAWQYSKSRKIAVKFLRKSLIDQPEVVDRFIGEAETITRLRHPNIVGLLGMGCTPGGAYFLGMDLIHGFNLAQRVESRAISIKEALGWTLQACDALEHAHARGIVHCDLKPANILLDENETIRVTDFGLARSLTDFSQRMFEVEGTVPFMAPEQASQCWGPISVRTDIYGLGAVLFTLLTGRPPWIGRRLADMLTHVISAIPVVEPLSLRDDLPESINNLCCKCLCKAPEGRYGSVSKLRAALVGLIQT